MSPETHPPTDPGIVHPAVAILGGGPLARVVAETLADAGVPIRLWSRSGATRSSLAERLPASVGIHDTVASACDGVQVIVLAVPLLALREVCRQYGELARGDHVVVYATRGAEPGFRLPHRILREETCVRKTAVLGGPIYPPEMARGRPVAAVLATRFDEAVRVVRGLTKGTSVRVHSSRDVVGVEVASAISSVTTVAVGMAEELSLGDTVRGVLLTRGLSEATSLGVRLGASPETFAGLAGVGDFIPRRVTHTERHLDLGRRLARGERFGDLPQSEQLRLDAPTTAFGAVQCASELRLALPLVTAVASVLRGEARADEALDHLQNLDFEMGEELRARRSVSVPAS